MAGLDYDEYMRRSRIWRWETHEALADLIERENKAGRPESKE